MLTSFLREQQKIGLGFREQTKSTILFIVTTDSIMSYNTTANKPTVVKYIFAIFEYTGKYTYSFRSS